MTTIEIEIDGKILTTAAGSMIIEAADNAGVRIPRFCYHRKLSVAANCRMCLVEVEKIGKPLPACATPVTPGMKVFTQSAKAIEAQKSVMEFLLINHPLDCPICDQGGACELQDISIGYGPDVSRYTEGKRTVKDEDLGSLIATDMTRCIQCTRCVRFGQEIAGMRELGTIGRNDRLEIGSYLKSHALHSELSGNIIDLCPVGALTSKPFRFTARAWELESYETIAPHDCVGSNIYLHTRRNEVMRVVPKDNEEINEAWIADRDRFSYQALYHEERLGVPLIKQDNQWHEVDWALALDTVSKKLSLIKEQQGGHQIAALASPQATLEEFYLLQKLLRGLGSLHIDHRLRQLDTSDQAHMPLSPLLGISLEALESQDVVVLIGANVRHEQPLVSHRLRKGNLQNTQIIAINPVDFDFIFSLAAKKIVSPQQLSQVLVDILEKKLFADFLEKKGKKTILLGALALNHPEAATLRSLAQSIAEKYEATLGYLTEGPNTTGAWIAGAIPHRGPAGESLTLAGYHTLAALQAKLPAYLLFNIEPELDMAYPVLAMQSLKAAECVVAFSAYRAPSLLDVADVILPIAPFAETSGTYINIEGRWQSFNAISKPYQEARPAWKILRVLGNLLQLSGFNYNHSEEIRDEVKKSVQQMPTRATAKFSPIKSLSNHTHVLQKNRITRITEWPLYRGDMLVRRANALQHAPGNDMPCIRLNTVTAAAYSLYTPDFSDPASSPVFVSVQQENQLQILPLVIDNRLPDNCALIAAGFPETAMFNTADFLTVSLAAKAGIGNA